MPGRFRIGDCVRIPDGRVGRVREVTGSTYRVRLGLDDGREQAGPSFGPDARGTLTLPIRVGPAAERLRAVRVVLEPAGEPVLAGERSR